VLFKRIVKVFYSALRTPHSALIVLCVALWGIACDKVDETVQQTIGRRVNSVGRVLPPDAAAPARQVLRSMSPEPRSLDPSINPYDTEATIFPFEPLLQKDEFWHPVPAAAARWAASPDGRTWTFHLRPGMRWSDGQPLTAHDFVYSFRRIVNPASGNIFAFFYYDIKNAQPISQGRMPDVEALGVRALDDTTLVIETEKPAPYFPHIVAFGDAVPVPRSRVEKYGRRWTEAEHIATNSGFKVAEWVHGSHMTLVPDPYYNGPHKPYLERVVHPFREAAGATILPYENNEVDIESVDLTDLERIERSPALQKDLVRFHAMTTWYLFFRTQQPPFNDIRVREAFTRAIDRDNLCTAILRDGGIPAYAMTPPGFAEYEGAAHGTVQGFDPERAKALLAAAGYPDGRGFPKQELWLRAPNPAQRMVGEAVQSMLREHLGVQVEIRTADPNTYMENLYNWRMNLGIISYGADFLDLRNMLDMIWHAQPRGFARHDWTNPAFDRLVDEAASELDPARRAKLYRDATALMASDYPAAFLYHNMGLQLRKPWVSGYTVRPDGTAGMLDWTKVYVAAQERM
jgi:ABC-type oligopeptide transport system substrate-binding subunit